MRVNMTQKLVEREIRKHTGGPVWLYDEGMPGFVLKIARTTAGALRATFLLRYGGRGRMRTYTIGRFGEYDVQSARERAEIELGKVRAGGDPVEERKVSRKVPTLTEWADEYLKEVELRKRSVREDRRFLGLAKLRWGSRPLNKITTDEVHRWFQTIAESHKITANRALASLRACLQAAWRRDKIAGNPAMKVRPLPENTPRARVLSDEELSRLAKAVRALTNPYHKLAFTLLLSTGARLSEVLKARWADFDLEAGTWRIPSPKAGKPQVVPLPATAVAMLRNTKRKGSLAVPGVTPDKPRFDLKKPWDALRVAAEIPDVHIHDLRRDYGLRVSKAAGLHVASKLLRHADVRVTEAVYAPLALADLRVATEQQSGELARVLKMKPRKARTA